MLTREFESAISDASASTRITRKFSVCEDLLLSNSPISNANAGAADPAKMTLTIAKAIAPQTLPAFRNRELIIASVPHLVISAKTNYLTGSAYDSIGL